MYKWVIGWLFAVSVAGAASDAGFPQVVRTSDGRIDTAETTYSTVVTSATIGARMSPYGTNGYVWTMSGGVPVWAAPVGGGTTDHAQNTDSSTDAVDWTWANGSDTAVADVTQFFGLTESVSGVTPELKWSKATGGNNRFEFNKNVYSSGGFVGIGSGLTDVDAELLDGQNSAYYRNAGNLNAGTLDDDRLPTTATWNLGGRLVLKGMTEYARGIGNYASDPDYATTAIEIWNSQIYRPNGGGVFYWKSGATPLKVYDPATSSTIWKMDSAGAMYPYPANGGTMYGHNRIKMGGTTYNETTSPIDIQVDGGYSGPMIDVGNTRQYASADTLTYGYAGSVNGIYGLFHMDVHAQRNVYGANGIVVGPGRQYQSGGAAGSLFIESAGSAGVPTNGNQILRVRTDTLGSWFNNHIGWKEGSVSQYFWFDDRIKCPEIETTGTLYANAVQTTDALTVAGNATLGDASGDAVTINAATVTAANLASGTPTSWLGRNASNQIVRSTSPPTAANVALIDTANGWTSAQTLPGVTVQGNLSVSTGTTTLTGPVALNAASVHAPNLPAMNAGGFLMRNGNQVGVATSGTMSLGLDVLTAKSIETTGTINIGGGATISKHLSATGTLTFDFSGGRLQTQTITVTGAAVGDTVNVGFPDDADIDNGELSWIWRVSAANTVKIIGYDIIENGPNISGTFRVDVWKH